MGKLERVTYGKNVLPKDQRETKRVQWEQKTGQRVVMNDDDSALVIYTLKDEIRKPVPTGIQKT